MTAGAAVQHLYSGGLFCAPFSSSSSVAGRWTIQMWSFLSMAMPDTWPRIQLPGRGFGQNGCGSKRGTSSARAACWATASADETASATVATNEVRIVRMVSSRVAAHCGCLSGPNRMLAHVPEKWAPVFRDGANVKGELMISSRRTVLARAVAVVAGFLLPAATFAQDTSAKAFLDAIYKAYVGKDTKGISLEGDAAVRRYFEPALAAMIIKDGKDAARRKEVPTLDGDPFVDAQ